jgi:hypothetical protein
MIEIVDVQETLKARGFAADAAPLLDSENPQLRMSAALICLELDQAKALATLESVEKTRGA